MPDFRAHHRPATPPSVGDELRLEPAEAHHLVTVNRARLGDIVTAFDGRGTEWTCALVAARKGEAVLRINAFITHPPLPCALTLGQALPKGGVMDDIVRHATELGTARIAPLETERTQVHLEGGRSDRKADKWRTAALEAAKQCGNPFLPEIAPVQPLDAFLAATAGAGLKLVASLHPGAQPLKAVLAEARAARGGHGPDEAVWLVGPEGDFSPAEMARIAAAGFLPVTLGPLVLRCDTAATAALALLRYEFGTEESRG